MRFTLTQEISSEISQDKADGVTNISNKLESFFKDKQYGNVTEILFGIICVAPVYEPFFKTRRPRLSKIKKSTAQDSIENILGMDIKLDFEAVLHSGSSEGVEEIVKDAILSNLKELNGYKSKFDIERFKKDMVSALILDLY